MKSSVSLPLECETASTPLLFKGLVTPWPVVKAAQSSQQDLSDYLLGFYQGAPVTVYQSDHSAGGRIFYNQDFTDFNFTRTRQSLDQVVQAILSQPSASSEASLNSYYVGSTAIKHWLPEFEQHNDLDMGELESLNSIWLGNRSMVAPHFDFPDNLACVVAGKRRFTLFPPDQMSNLYIGPVDITPSGQPVSMVDIRNPDYEQFPKYKEAERHAMVFELEAGDALFIPSMWWHGVESLDRFNVLINYWWRKTPSYLGSPLAALHHALLSMNGLPQEQRENWGRIFQALIFERGDDDIAHLPSTLRGMYEEIDSTTAQAIKRSLSDMLKS